MEKFAILLGYFDKQWKFINIMYDVIIRVDVGVYEKRYLFALKAQQFYTAIEDLFKQIAKAFENHISDLGSYHKELLIRMSAEVPGIRPAVLSKNSLHLLNKICAFRHFIRHAYDCELDEVELRAIQDKLRGEFTFVKEDITQFKQYVVDLTDK